MRHRYYLEYFFDEAIRELDNSDIWIYYLYTPVGYKINIG